VPPAVAQIFSNITPEQYECLVRRANSAGLRMNGNSGIASTRGVDVAWDYSPEASRLTVQCLTAPFFIKLESVDASIRDLVEESGCLAQ
jgi:hypothetical protein